MLSSFRMSWSHSAGDGSNGTATVTVSQIEKQALDQVAARTASWTDINPPTGAELGAGPDGGIVGKEPTR
jgi:hypothetical protein